MVTNSGSGKGFKIPLISVSELESKSVTYDNSQESGVHEDETSLPALTSELIEAQHSQCAEIAEGQRKLSTLKESIKEEEEKFTRITADLHAVAKLVCLAQDEASSTEAECCSSKNGMFSIVKENALLQSSLLDLECQLEANQRVCVGYCKKMNGHIQKVSNIEQSHEVYQQVATLQNNILEVSNEKTMQLLDDGNIDVDDQIRQLEDKIVTLEASRSSEAIKQMECYKLEVTNNNIVQQLRQDIALLKKRLQAQLTRMHRQLQSLRHCSEKNRKLQCEIQQLKLKMDQQS